MPELRRSPLDDRHRAQGASMTGFGGWDMPLDYGSVVAEHKAVREGCGAFDLSHLGTIAVTGPQAQDCVQGAFTNDVSGLPAGRAHYTLCLDEGGGIIDDLLVYHLPWGFFVVPNAANAAHVLDALRDCAHGRDCEVADVKSALACIALQGPDSADVAVAAGIDTGGLGYLDCRDLDLPSAGPDAAGEQAHGPTSGVLSRSGYTGERGFEIFCPAERAGNVWDRVLAAGAVPAGLGCRDTLRLEMGYPLHGQDISIETSPVEARLGWAVKPGTGFRGEDAYVRDRESGPTRRLWGLKALGRGIPRAHCAVRDGDGRELGETTSGTFSPTLRIGIAMAYLDVSVAEDDEVVIDVRGKGLAAAVVRPPFVDRDPRA